MENGMADIIPLSPETRLGSSRIRKNINDFPVYKKYLDAAFWNKSIKNIAITGNFGVGKSSILQSYDVTVHRDEDKDGDGAGNENGNGNGNGNRGGKKFLYVSLSDLTGRSMGEAEKQKLEYSLLCQILAVCEEKLLPDSSFRLIPQRQDGRGAMPEAGAAARLAAAVYLWAARDGVLGALEGAAAQLDVPAAGAAFIPLAFYVLLGGLAAYAAGGMAGCLLRRRIALSRMKISGGPVKAKLKLSPVLNYLEQYIFELIYALESIAPKIDYTVIFEDFDRLDKDSCIEIFTKLREINKLVNARLPAGEHMRFIYVFSDGIFDYTRQTKFFDYCLPVIPVLSEKNAAEELRLEYFDAIHVKDTYQIAETAAPYLTDLRTVHSIINDYHVFEEIERDRNGPLPNEWKKALLAFMIYKNLEPQDYDKIRENRSAVFHDAEGELAHRELIDALREQKYLSGECLLFIGYSKEQMKLQYAEILKTRPYEEKKDNLDNDKKGLYLEIISEAAQAAAESGDLKYREQFFALFGGIEFAFLSYLLNYEANSDPENRGEWLKGHLPDINKILYDSIQHHHSGEPVETCEKGICDLFWEFDAEAARQLLRYLNITGYWDTGWFDWFFTADTEIFQKATDANKVRYFLDFRKSPDLVVPDAVDAAARSWLKTLPAGGIDTCWADESLLEMIVLLFSLDVPDELYQVEMTIKTETSSLSDHLLQYTERHYWDYGTEQRRTILFNVFMQYRRLPDRLFSQKKYELKYISDERRVRDFLWIWGFLSDKNGVQWRILIESAKQWLSSPNLNIWGTWDADSFLLPKIIDLVYPSPYDVPDSLRHIQIATRNREMPVKDFLNQYYTHFYWEDNNTDEKRMMILMYLTQNGYWDSKSNDSRWFFDGKNGSDPARLQYLLNVLDNCGEEMPNGLNVRIQYWISEATNRMRYWENMNIIRLIDSIYASSVPAEIRRRPLIIENNAANASREKTIGAHLRDFKFLYYWNYNQDGRLAFLKALFGERYWWNREEDMGWFFQPKEPAKFSSDKNKAGDFLELCQWIDDKREDYRNIAGFLASGYNWILTIGDGGITTVWEDDSLIHMILTVQDRLPTGIPAKLREITLQINGKTSTLGNFLRKTKQAKYASAAAVSK